MQEASSKSKKLFEITIPGQVFVLETLAKIPCTIRVRKVPEPPPRPSHLPNLAIISNIDAPSETLLRTFPEPSGSECSSTQSVTFLRTHARINMFLEDVHSQCSGSSGASCEVVTVESGESLPVEGSFCEVSENPLVEKFCIPIPATDGPGKFVQVQFNLKSPKKEPQSSEPSQSLQSAPDPESIESSSQGPNVVIFEETTSESVGTSISPPSELTSDSEDLYETASTCSLEEKLDSAILEATRTLAEEAEELVEHLQEQLKPQQAKTQPCEDSVVAEALLKLTKTWAELQERVIANRTRSPDARLNITELLDLMAAVMRKVVGSKRSFDVESESSVGSRNCLTFSRLMEAQNLSDPDAQRKAFDDLYRMHRLDEPSTSQGYSPESYSTPSSFSSTSTLAVQQKGSLERQFDELNRLQNQETNEPPHRTCQLSPKDLKLIAQSVTAQLRKELKLSFGVSARNLLVDERLEELRQDLREMKSRINDLEEPSFQSTRTEELLVSTELYGTLDPRDLENHARNVRLAQERLNMRK